MRFGDRMLFGVPDEITDMMRSLEMVEVNIDIYYDSIRTTNVFQGYRVRIVSPEGVLGTPRQRYGPYWAKGGTDQPLVG